MSSGRDSLPQRIAHQLAIRCQMVIPEYKHTTLKSEKDVLMFGDIYCLCVCMSMHICI